MHAAAVSAARRREQAQDPRPRSNRSKNLKTFRPQCNVVGCRVYYSTVFCLFPTEGTDVQEP